MSIATAVIPVSPQHGQTGIFNEAVESVRRQTIRTEVIVIHDKNGRGAAFARNKGTSQVKTPFVIWLDADDVLMPSFVEDTIRCYQRGSFVYSNWQLQNKVATPPAQLDPFGIGQQHIITTLMPVFAWRDSGGFDETLETLEDEDFYRRIAAYGWQGIHCDKVLVDYRRHLGNSFVNRDTHDPDIIIDRVKKAARLFQLRYERYRMNFELHQNKTQAPKISAIGNKQDNDVLCEVMGSPMSHAGPVTGRRYPKAGFNKPAWIDIDDARARPNVWRIIASNPQQISPDPVRVVELAMRAKQAPMPRDVQKVDYSALSMDDLRDEVAKYGVGEIDVCADMDASWQKRKKEMIAYLEAKQ